MPFKPFVEFFEKYHTPFTVAIVEGPSRFGKFNLTNFLMFSVQKASGGAKITVKVENPTLVQTRTEEL